MSKRKYPDNLDPSTSLGNESDQKMAQEGSRKRQETGFQESHIPRQEEQEQGTSKFVTHVPTNEFAITVEKEEQIISDEDESEQDLEAELLAILGSSPTSPSTLQNSNSAPVRESKSTSQSATTDRAHAPTSAIINNHNMPNTFITPDPTNIKQHSSSTDILFPSSSMVFPNVRRNLIFGFGYGPSIRLSTHNIPDETSFEHGHKDGTTSTHGPGTHNVTDIAPNAEETSLESGNPTWSWGETPEMSTDNCAALFEMSNEDYEDLFAGYMHEDLTKPAPGPSPHYDTPTPSNAGEMGFESGEITLKDVPQMSNDLNNLIEEDNGAEMMESIDRIELQDLFGHSPCSQGLEDNATELEENKEVNYSDTRDSIASDLAPLIKEEVASPCVDPNYSQDGRNRNQNIEFGTAQAPSSGSNSITVPAQSTKQAFADRGQNNLGIPICNESTQSNEGFVPQMMPNSFLPRNSGNQRTSYEGNTASSSCFGVLIPKIDEPLAINLRKKGRQKQLTKSIQFVQKVPNNIQQPNPLLLSRVGGMHNQHQFGSPLKYSHSFSNFNSNNAYISHSIPGHSNQYAQNKMRVSAQLPQQSYNQGHQPQGYQPQGYQPQGLQPQRLQPQGHLPFQVSNMNSGLNYRYDVPHVQQMRIPVQIPQQPYGQVHHSRLHQTFQVSSMNSHLNYGHNVPHARNQMRIPAQMPQQSNEQVHQPFQVSNTDLGLNYVHGDPHRKHQMQIPAQLLQQSHSQIHQPRRIPNNDTRRKHATIIAIRNNLFSSRGISLASLDGIVELVNRLPEMRPRNHSQLHQFPQSTNTDEGSRAAIITAMAIIMFEKQTTLVQMDDLAHNIKGILASEASNAEAQRSNQTFRQNQNHAPVPISNNLQPYITTNLKNQVDGTPDHHPYGLQRPSGNIANTFNIGANTSNSCTNHSLYVLITGMKNAVPITGWNNLPSPSCGIFTAADPHQRPTSPVGHKDKLDMRIPIPTSKYHVRLQCCLANYFNYLCNPVNKARFFDFSEDNMLVLNLASLVGELARLKGFGFESN